MEEFVNYYEILEISRNAELEEIEKRYKEISRKLINLQNSPDDNAQREAAQKSKQLPKAKKVLLDRNERQKYDRQLEEYEKRREQVPFENTQQGVLGSSSELIKKGYELFSSGLVREALEIAKTATARYGEDPNTWALLAEARFRIKDIESSIYEYKRAIDLRPREAKFYHSLGTVYEAAKRNDDALNNYQSAVKYDQSIFYQLNLGDFYGRIDRWNESIDVLERCYTIEPNDPNVITSLTQAYLGRLRKYGSHKTKNDIKNTLQDLDKIMNLSLQANSDNIDSILQMRNNYCNYLKRKFNGSYILGFIGSLICALSSGSGDLIYVRFILIAVLYYLSCCPPKYFITPDMKTFSRWLFKGGAGFVIIFILVSPIAFPILIFLNFIKNYTGGNLFFNDKYLRYAFIQTNYPAFLKNIFIKPNSV